MENTETVLPEAEQAGASDQPNAEQLANTELQAEGEKPEGEKEAKPERHPLEKELAKERRRNQAIVRRLHEAESKAREFEDLRSRSIGDTNQDKQGDSERQSLTDADLDALLNQREQQRRQAESERDLSAKAVALRKELGEDFETTTEDLSLMLRDAKKQLAVLRSEQPAALVRYMTDPDNAEEIERMARMDDFDYGRAMARIEGKLEAKKAPDKPKPSSAAAPIEAARGGGVVHTSAPADMQQYMAWANKHYSRR